MAVNSDGSTVFIGGVGTDSKGVIYVWNEISATPVSVSCNPSKIVIGRSSACKVTAVNAGAGGGAPTGTVSLSETNDSSGRLSAGSCTLRGVSGHSGTSSCSFTFTEERRSNHIITARYGGDLHHESGSNTTVVTSALNPTDTTVACTPPTIVLGATTRCTATATGLGASPAKIVFRTKYALLVSIGAFSAETCITGTASVTCTVDFSAYAAGGYILGASYPGDAQSAASSADANVTVTLHPTTTTVSCAPTAIPVGAMAQCTATASGVGPTRSQIDFQTRSPVGAVGVFSSEACTAGTGTATCTADFSGNLPGGYGVSASYPGDLVSSASSANATETVTSHPTTTAVACTGVYPWDCTATVTDTSSATTIPGGTVTFTSSGPPAAGGSCTLTPVGHGSTSVSACTVAYSPQQATGAKLTITGDYSGDATHVASSGAELYTG